MIHVVHTFGVVHTCWYGSSSYADFMYIYYGLPTAQFPLVPIPNVSLCLGRVGGCPVVGGAHAMPRPARPLPSFPSLTIGADHHSRSHPRGHGVSLYRPSDGPLSSAEYWD